MGMFDYFRCEVPLPDAFTGELQTKDFACDMVEHVITAEGRLLLTNIDEVQEVPKAERPYPDAELGSLEEVCGCIRNITSQHDANFHGLINFYGGEGDVNADDGSWKWHEYNAKFTDGQLVKIELAPNQ